MILLAGRIAEEEFYDVSNVTLDLEVLGGGIYYYFKIYLESKFIILDDEFYMVNVIIF